MTRIHYIPYLRIKLTLPVPHGSTRVRIERNTYIAQPELGVHLQVELIQHSNDIFIIFVQNQEYAVGHEEIIINRGYH